jgi:hypothetical protein
MLLMKGFGQEYKILVKFAHGRTVSVMTGKGTDGPLELAVSSGASC